MNKKTMEKKTKKRNLPNKKNKKRDDTFMTREEFIEKINKSLNSPRKPFSFEEFDRKYLFPLEEAKRKKKALQGK